MLDDGHQVPSCPGLAVLTYNATLGWVVTPVEVAAHLSCSARQGLVLLASPPVTPTIANACPVGRVLPHWGQETSLPTGSLSRDGGAAATGAIPVTNSPRRAR